MSSDFTDIRRRLAARRPRRAEMDGRIPAAVAAVLVEGEEGLEILLIKRSEREGDPWSGQMAMPGGRREPEDADLLETAIRETREETGVALSDADLLGELDDLSPAHEHLPPILVRPYVFGLPVRPPAHARDEVDLVLWVPLRRLRESLQEEEITVREFNLRAPGYRLGEHFVWGLTERMLTPFLALLDLPAPLD